MSENKFNWGQAVGAGMGLAGGIIGQIGAKKREKRQMDLQIKGQKEMAEFNRQQQMKLWHDTNFDAQRKEMEKAGLNVGLMYEGGGAGGVTQAQAGDVSAPQGQSEQLPMQGAGIGMAMGMQLAQIDLLKAQAEKTRAEIPNVELTGESTVEETRAKKFINDLNDSLREIERNARSQKAEADYWEDMERGSQKQTEYSEKHTNNEPINTKGGRAVRVELEKLEQGLIKAKNENNILEAETQIKAFEAKMANDGIPPNSPWYAKLLGDLLQKTGLMDWLNAGKGAVKSAVK